ncbi:ATP-dependent DNA ligase [Pseudonocardia sp. TRM90224]|uniref:ATP-dependent DNA ligase n=1 Tax=Pseudonocardia sp. TRM90224 TaxID=2812678 RepID=UPI001E40BCF2|nr:hypothetical protein [Pseudonocardia sp. TRM90224]
MQLQSRQQKPLTRYFPEIVEALHDQVAGGTVLDGELVVMRDGRMDFTALQRRIHPAASHAARRGVLTPATFVTDVLALEGIDLRGEPYRKRRKVLRELLEDAAPPLALMPATREIAGAEAWMREHSDVGIEGVVVKDRSRGYRPGRTHWTKVRTRTMSEAIVGGVLGSLRAPEALVLGRVDERGRLRVAGRTTPLTLPARRELGALLQPPRGAHPWPARISSGRFGQLPPEPVPFVQVEPLLVVEVDADVCFELDRWRHATVFRRIRAELRPEDLSPTANRGRRGG